MRHYYAHVNEENYAHVNEESANSLIQIFFSTIQA